MAEGEFTFEGVTWGGDTRFVVTKSAANMGDVRVEDADNAYGDGVLVGRDSLGAGSMSWEVTTDADHFEDPAGTNALDLWEDLAAAWRVAVREQIPGKLYPLSYTALGRRRRIYGRPRRQDIPSSGDILAMQGQAAGAIEFMLAEPYTYGEDEQSITIDRITTGTGGVTIPTQIPFVVGVTPGARNGSLHIDGRAPTPLLVKFHGPVIDPYLRGPGLDISLRGKIDPGMVVTVDTRQKTIDRGLTNVRGALVRGSSLGARLNPGTHQLTYGGSDATNSSFVTVSWRPAYYSI